MTTLRNIAENALRKIGAASAGEPIAAEDYTLAYEGLLRICQRLPSYGAGRILDDVEASASLTAVDDSRILAQSSITVTLPKPRRGAQIAIVSVTGATVTVSPSARKIEGSTANITTTTAGHWFYRDDAADWVRIDNMTANSQSPLGTGFDSDLMFLTCEEIKGTFSEGVTPELMMSIRDAHARIGAYFVRSKTTNGDLPRSVRGASYVRRYG